MTMWNDRFSEPGFAYGVEPNDFLREHAERLGGPCLSLAEGEGRNAVFLASLGLRVMAVDASAVGLAKAVRLAANHGLSIDTLVTDLDFFKAEPASFRSVVSIFAHVSPEVRRRVHAGVKEWLVPGGVLVLEAYAPGQAWRDTGGPRDPVLCMALADVMEELAGMEFLVARETEREVIEGRYHTGKALVTQLVAVKPGKKGHGQP